MPFISTVHATSASGEIHAMYERQQGFWGYIPNYATLFSHRPEVMARWGRLLAEIRRPADARRFELVTFVVALELRHSPCSLAHGKALADIIGKDAVLAIANGEKPANITDAEAAMLDYARQIARDASTINYGHVERLKKLGLSDAEIFDIAAIASARCFFTKILDALGSEPDAGFMRIDADLRSALTVGRPISHKKPEYLPTADCA
jgi:uncharacterized peroxidase-related enzyme